jgi:hypothetical protein
LLVKPLSSFFFVDLLIHQLALFGCSLEAFLKIYATSFDYYALQTSLADIPIVSWSPSGPAEPTVYKWCNKFIIPSSPHPNKLLEPICATSF